jgi:hypothetical protein
MRTLLFTLMSLACSAVLAATVYKWIDENGVVHYSDQPHANAEKVQVQAPQTYKATPVDQGTVPLPPDQVQAPAAYTGCTIVQPQDQQDFSNIESLVIAVRVEPQLHGGDQIYILMDGGALNNGSPVGNSFTVNPIERGTHTAQAMVRDSGGQLMCQTPAVTFSVHKASIANPVNPVRPH